MDTGNFQCVRSGILAGCDPYEDRAPLFEALRGGPGSASRSWRARLCAARSRKPGRPLDTAAGEPRKRRAAARPAAVPKLGTVGPDWPLDNVADGLRVAVSSRFSEPQLACPSCPEASEALQQGTLCTFYL